ncbi:MAG: hypothetical protein WCT14_03325 [Treponemataceae bacterium]
MKRTFLAAASLLVACALLFSCSHAAPRLDSVSLRLVYRAAGVERLSFFALVADEDGFLDLDALHLLNNSSQLYWSLSAKDWLKVERTGETWIGSHTIAMADDAKFPRGAYRAVLVDKGGDRIERTVAFDPPLASARRFPSLSGTKGRYRVISEYPKNVIVGYDSSGAQSRTVQLKAKEGLLSELELGPAIQSIALWAEDEESRVAALTDPVSIKALY